MIQSLADDAEFLRRVYLDVAGRTTRVKVTSANESGIEIAAMGSELPVRWDAIAPKRFAGLCRKYVGDSKGPRLHLAWYALRHNLTDLAAEMSAGDGELKALIQKAR